MSWIFVKQSASPWTPLSFGNALEGWWDFSDTSTLFDATSGGNNVTTNNSEILRVNDKSGNGIHLPKANASTSYFNGISPTLLKTSVQNGLSAMEVDKSSSTAFGGGFGLENVAIGNNVASLSAVFVAKEGVTVNNFNGGPYRVRRPGSSLPRISVGFNEAGPTLGNRFYAFQADGNGGNTDYHNFGAEAWRIITHTANYTQPTNSLRVFLNGKTTPEVSKDIAGFTGNTEASNASLVQIGQSTYNSGQDTGLSRSMSGQLGEIMFVAADLATDVALRQKVEGQLAHKWGLTASLPADHPYKAAAPME